MGKRVVFFGLKTLKIMQRNAQFLAYLRLLGKKTLFENADLSVCILNCMQINVKEEHDTTHYSKVLDGATVHIELTFVSPLLVDANFSCPHVPPRHRDERQINYNRWNDQKLRRTA
jgi:hypothetical protein